MTVDIAEFGRQIQAMAEGRPISRGETLHFPLADEADALLLAFVRMGGESGPWGVAVKRACDADAQIRVVAEPRSPKARAKLMEWLAPILLEHLGHPDFVKDDGSHDRLKQLWVPSSTHLDMLHFLDFTYSHNDYAPSERVGLLKALGRGAGWAFRESQRPGQVRVMAASDALRESFSFPAERVRLEHLGFQLALLTTDGDLSARMAAASRAEDLSVATTLNPEVERGVLAPLVTAYDEAVRDEDVPALKEARAAIREHLEPELRRRIELTERAFRMLRDDPRPINPGVTALIELGRDEHGYQYRRMELRVRAGKGYAPSPETDRRSDSAASRFHKANHCAEVLAGALAHHDRQLRVDALLAGDAFSGRIVEVRDEGTGKAKIPVWVVEDAGELPLSFREGSSVCVAGVPKRVGTVRAVEMRGGRRQIELEITGWKTVPKEAPPSLRPAVSSEYQGEEVVLLKHQEPAFSRKKSWAVRDHGGPGAWLTHPRQTRRS